MAETDPKTTIKAVVEAYLLGDPILNDAGGACTTVCRWEGGPETLKYLFYGVPDAAVVITFGEPRTRSIRDIQDVPVHYLMSYPITVTTANKPLTGVLTSTAARMQYKATYRIRRAIEGGAQSGVGPPAYTITVRQDSATHKRIGGLDIWETTHLVEYETDYA